MDLDILKSSMYKSWLRVWRGATIFNLADWLQIECSTENIPAGFDSLRSTTGKSVI